MLSILYFRSSTFECKLKILISTNTLSCRGEISKTSNIWNKLKFQHLFGHDFELLCVADPVTCLRWSLDTRMQQRHWNPNIPFVIFCRNQTATKKLDMHNQGLIIIVPLPTPFESRYPCNFLGTEFFLASCMVDTSWCKTNEDENGFLMICIVALNQAIPNVPNEPVNRNFLDQQFWK